MPTIAKQSQSAIWIPPDDGLFNPAIVFQLGQAGMGDITLPGPGDRTIFYGTDPFGNPVPGGFERATPGQPSTTIENYVTLFRDNVQKMRDLSQTRYVQLRIHDCIRLDHPNGWDVLIHLGSTQTGDGTISAPVNREFSDARIGQSHPVNGIYHVVWVSQGITKLTTTETTDANGIVFLSDLESGEGCGGGYPGPDLIGYIACDAAAAATANILYTTDGGSTWTVTSADPFAADEHVDFPVLSRKDEDEFRLVVGRISTDAGNPGEIAWADVTFGSEATTTWNTVNVGSNNGDIITTIFWPKWQRLYACTDNNRIFLSTDQGESWTQVYAGSNPIRAMTRDVQTGNVYAVGDSNLILVEKGETGTFEALTGPTGSNNSNAVAIASDGTLWLGNGTAIFYSKASLPTAAGQWTSSKDFGANHSVIGVDCKAGAAVKAGLGGDSQLLHVLVNDGTGTDGDVWTTVDGGGAWNEMTDLTNSGYNAGYFSPIDPNLIFIVGEDDGSTAIIHKVSPSGGV